MDAQELPQTLKSRERSAVNSPSESLPSFGCVSATCRQRCALEVIDELLGLPRSAVSGEEVDLLLDLRWQLRRRAEGEASCGCSATCVAGWRRGITSLFFRLRRWLENHLVARVRICPAAEADEVPVKLDHYCVEAIRRSCLCASLSRAAVMLVPRLQFAFRPSSSPVRSTEPGRKAVAA